MNLLPDSHHLTPKQIRQLLEAVQDGTLLVLVPEDETPDLVPSIQFADWDVYQVIQRPLTPSVPAFGGPRAGQDQLLACMLLHLSGVAPDRVRNLADDIGLLAPIVRHSR